MMTKNCKKITAGKKSASVLQENLSALKRDHPAHENVNYLKRHRIPGSRIRIRNTGKMENLN
jgi:hypothetical protein